jgi:phosphoribosyl-ATP pyrophosphohydrolase
MNYIIVSQYDIYDNHIGKGTNMAGIMTAISAVKKVYDIITNVSNVAKGKKDMIALLQEGMAAYDRSFLITTNGSITKFLSGFTIEPIIIASSSTKQSEIIDKLMEIETDIFASFYSQAFTALTSYYNLPTSLVIDVLGTTGSRPSNSYSHRLSSESVNVDYYADLFNTDSSILSIEATAIKPNDMNFKDQSTSSMLIRNLEITINSNISGKDGNKTHSIIIPFMVKTNVIFTTIDQIVNMLTPNHISKSLGYRFDDYRAGVISLKELIFADDLIKQYKDNKFKDKDGLVDLINQQRSDANTKLLNNAIGFEKSYNMLIVTSDEKILLDKQMNGNIDSEKYKQKLLEDSNSMMIAIIDNDYERVYILMRDIRGRTDISFKTIMRRKDSGIDLSEIMKSLIATRSPII